MSAIARLCWVGLLTLPCCQVLLHAVSVHAAQGLGADAAERLVRETWYEGLPLDEAANIDTAGAARLVSMLQDPDESEHHANILVALGACGQPSSYPAIEAWATLPRSGEVDRATFRAWQALPQALGRLAPHDRRALGLLTEQLDAEPPGWHFRQHRGARLATLIQRGAATGLATSGLTEADKLLENAEAESTGTRKAHLLESLSMLRAATKTD